LIFYIVGECPICIGSGDLIALESKFDKSLLRYCPACGCAWLGLEENIDNEELHSLDEIAPDGVERVSWNRLLLEEFNKFSITNVYDGIEDLIE